MIRNITQIICDSCGLTRNDADDLFEDESWWYRDYSWLKIEGRYNEHYCPECKTMARLCQKEKTS